MTVRIALATPCARGPLTRTTPIPAGTGAVAIATMVSVGQKGTVLGAWDQALGASMTRLTPRGWRDQPWDGPGSWRPAPGPYFAEMMTVFTNASPMLSDVASPRSATAMWTMRRS